MRPIFTAGVTASSDHMSRPFGISCSASSLKFCWTRVVRRVDDRRVAGDGHGLLQRRDREFDVHGGREAQRDHDVSRFSVLKPGKLERHRVGAGRQRRESGSCRRFRSPTSATPISDGLVAVTVTPGSTAPLLSATLPLIVPVLLAPPPCANAVRREQAGSQHRDDQMEPSTSHERPPPSVTNKTANDRWCKTTSDANAVLDTEGAKLSIEPLAGNYLPPMRRR